MLYMKDKRPYQEPPLKTYTEEEELKYNIQPAIKLVPKIYNFVFFSIMFMFLIFTFGANASFFQKTTCFESHWDGAGDQWTCGNCGTTNYKWQMSCSNCGNSQ